MSTLEPASAKPLVLPGDRGERDVHIMGLDDYFRFGALVRQYQREHPETLVRATAKFSPSIGHSGLMTVRWWPRGEEQPRG